MRTDRILLLWKPAAPGATAADISLPGWITTPVSGPAAFERNKTMARVGVFVVDHSPSERVLDELENLLRRTPGIAWVAVIAPELISRSRLMSLVASHAYDFHSLPLNHSMFEVSVGHAWGMASLRARQQQHRAVSEDIPEIIGVSHAIEKIKEQIRIFSRSSAPVLITGESGTGKEGVAAAIHRLSDRSSKPFVAVNCGGLPEGLIQSELFGHKRGAFTGALADRAGKIEMANEGSIFLDEIGDLPKAMQVNLLRFLQEGTIEKLGSSSTISMNVRVIAATHVDLVKAVLQGAFREDLLYRLNVLHIRVPPLRERCEDIAVLAEHFLMHYSKMENKGIKGYLPECHEKLLSHNWPGNVRELVNCVRRAVLLTSGKFVTPDDLEITGESAAVKRHTLSSLREDADRRAIEATLRFTGNNISAASRLLNISRLSLYRLMEKYQLHAFRR